MLRINLIKQSLIIAITLSTITCSFIQKTKFIFKSSKYISLYSFFVNIIIGIIFCNSFTKITFPNSIWIGFFSFIESDTLYKTLEGKLAPYSKIAKNKEIILKEENIINRGDK